MNHYHNRIKLLRDEYKSSKINLLLPEKILESLSKIRFVIVIDSPDLSDFKSSEYLTGRAGKAAKKLFSNYNLSSDFNNEVLVLSKTAIVSQTPNDLILMQKKQQDLFKKAQIIMVDLLFDIYEKIRPENIWILESPGGCNSFVFSEFYGCLKKKAIAEDRFNKTLFSYTHFANNNFELEYLRYYYRNSSSEKNKDELLHELGKKNIHKIFDSI